MENAPPIEENVPRLKWKRNCRPRGTAAIDLEGRTLLMHILPCDSRFPTHRILRPVLLATAEFFDENTQDQRLSQVLPRCYLA